jgi:hypothetical protein
MLSGTLNIMDSHSVSFSPAAIIKGNHTNCAQFANSNRLNWLFGRLGSQASGEGSGMLDVLHCVLIDSPEALNMMRVSDNSYHISLSLPFGHCLMLLTDLPMVNNSMDLLLIFSLSPV